MMAANPADPLGYALLGRTLWGRQLSEGQGLNIDRYAGSAFYAGGGRMRVPVSSEQERQFRGAIGQAMAAARRQLNQQPANLRAMFVLGFAHQTLASYEFSMNGSWWAAFKEAENALKLHRAVSAQAPQFADAMLQQAVSHYAMACLPGSIRWLPFLLGYRGSKEQGKRELAEVAQRGPLFGDDARTLLVFVYAFDGEYAQATRTLEELGRRYPGNYLVHLELAGLALKMRQPLRAVDIYKALLARLEAGTGAGPMAALERPAVFLRLGVAAREASDLDASVQWLRQALSGGASRRVETAAHLEMGKTLDLQGQRPQALAEYRQAAAAEDFLGTRQEAAALMNRGHTARR
jgi:tetratricopeptide (TPR) repeat protein